jgi:hypothetical protein
MPAVLPFIYVIGGITSGNIYQKDVWRTGLYSYATFDCVTSNATWDARAYTAGVFLSGDATLIMSGGLGAAGRFNDVWKSDDIASAGTATWSCVTSNAQWSPRHSHTMIQMSGTLYLSGGNTSGNNANNEIWKTTDGSTWTQVNTTDPEYPVIFKHDTGATWEAAGDVHITKQAADTDYDCTFRGTTSGKLFCGVYHSP